MKRYGLLPALLLLVVACLASPGYAADRVRAGQWTGTTITGGKTFKTSSCLSAKDAQALNGDAKAVRASPDEAKARAHVLASDETGAMLANWIQASLAMLAP